MINKLKALLLSFRNSKDGKVLISNTGYLALLQVTSYIFPLLTIPYLARVIGVQGFGKIAFASGVLVWLITISDWGFNYTGTRDIAKNRDDHLKVSDIFSKILWARFSLMILSFMFLLTLIAIVPYFKENKNILLLSFLSVPSNILLPQWFFQAMERMKFITIFSLLSRFIFTLSVFVFIKEPSDFILHPLLMASGQAICGVVAMYIIVRKWNIKILAPSIHSIITTIKSSTDVFINNIMHNFYNSLAIVLLGLWWGSHANGIYDAGRKLISIMHSFMDILIRVSFPVLSRKINAHDLFAKLYLTLASITSLITFIIAPIFIKLFFTESFSDAVTVMRLSSITIFFSALIKVYGTNYLIIEGHEKILRIITFKYSLFGFIISLPLVYYYSYIGAAITLVITQGIMGFSIARKARSIKLSLKYS